MPPRLPQSSSSAFERFNTPDRLLRNPSLYHADPSQFYAFLDTVSSSDDEEFLQNEDDVPVLPDDEVIVISKRELEFLKNEHNSQSEISSAVTPEQIETLKWQVSSHLQLLVQTSLAAAQDQSCSFAFGPALAHLQHIYQLYNAATGFLSVAGVASPVDSCFNSPLIEALPKFLNLVSSVVLPINAQSAERLAGVFDKGIDPLLFPTAVSAVTPPKPTTGRGFSEEEDRLLVTGVKRFGATKVSKIRDVYMPRRSEKEIKSRLKEIKKRSDDDVMKGLLMEALGKTESNGWSDYMDDLLISLIATHGHDFSTISSHFSEPFNRVFLRNRWLRRLAGSKKTMTALNVQETSLPDVIKLEESGHNKFKCGFVDCSNAFHTRSEVYAHYYRDHLKLFEGKMKKKTDGMSMTA
ncbi:hypothetical protein RCL1_004499 [Eukaryota sp. TZLM3-RCL]